MRNKSSQNVQLIFISSYIRKQLSEIWIVQYSRRQSMINHCDRHITLLSDTDISFGLFNLFTYFLVHFG